jgi:hypothetical protein
VQFAALHMSANGTSVWTGRALQAESDDLEVIGLAKEKGATVAGLEDLSAQSPLTALRRWICS